MEPIQQNSNSTATPLKVGITGGIGSGKTTACKIFETLGIPVYYADERAKWLMVNDLALKKEILDLFGNEAYFKNGSLNRKYISAVVFQDKHKLRALNGIVHPAVFKDGDEWFGQISGVPYTLKEAALLIESGGYKSVDKLIVVSAPEDLRLERVVKRDMLKKEDVLARIRSQISEAARLEHADFVIQNDGQKSLINQVFSIHRELLTICANRLANNEL
jgi:dephospho-CoA kinase